MVINYRYYLFTHDLCVASSFCSLPTEHRCRIQTAERWYTEMSRYAESNIIYKLKINIHTRQRRYTRMNFSLLCYSFIKPFPFFIFFSSSAFFQPMEFSTFFTARAFGKIGREMISRSLACEKLYWFLSPPSDIIIAWCLSNVLRLIIERNGRKEKRPNPLLPLEIVIRLEHQLCLINFIAGCLLDVIGDGERENGKCVAPCGLWACIFGYPLCRPLYPSAEKFDRTEICWRWKLVVGGFCVHVTICLHVSCLPDKAVKH